MVHRTAGGSADADAPLMEAGLDSLGAVELRNQLQQAAGEGAALPSTLVFDHPTARQLAQFLQLFSQAVILCPQLISICLHSGQGRTQPSFLFRSHGQLTCCGVLFFPRSISLR